MIGEEIDRTHLILIGFNVKEGLINRPWGDPVPQPFFAEVEI
jgi:hypothetical protein